jgi:chitodextrinase
MGSRSVSQHLRNCTLAVALVSCYAPGNWDECRVRCSLSGGCPLGASCGGDGYCHRVTRTCTGTGGAQPDVEPPAFDGVVSATPAVNSIVLSWKPATDDVTPTAELVYLVYQASSVGAESLVAPTAVTPPGVVSFAVPGLAPSTRYWFIVRARDQAGNIEQNRAEVSATTLAGNDTTPPSFAGLTSAQATAPNEIGLSWTAASDDVTPVGGIVYLVYSATSAGGEDFRVPSATTAAGVTSYQMGGLTPAILYYFVVRARDQAGNIDTNIVERTAAPFADTTPPSFGGAKSAAPSGLTSMTVSWSPATDNVTPSDQIVYDVYESARSGHENFATPTVTSAPGASRVDVGGLLPATIYYFVVRARDRAGNEDTNTVEVAASIL